MYGYSSMIWTFDQTLFRVPRHLQVFQGLSGNQCVLQVGCLGCLCEKKTLGMPGMHRTLEQW